MLTDILDIFILSLEAYNVTLNVLHFVIFVSLLRNFCLKCYLGPGYLAFWDQAIS